MVLRDVDLPIRRIGCYETLSSRLSLSSETRHCHIITLPSSILPPLPSFLSPPLPCTCRTCPTRSAYFYMFFRFFPSWFLLVLSVVSTSKVGRSATSRATVSQVPGQHGTGQKHMWLCPSPMCHDPGCLARRTRMRRLGICAVGFQDSKVTNLDDLTMKTEKARRPGRTPYPVVYY